MRAFYVGASAVVLLFLVWGGYIFDIDRLWDQETKLRPGESRIESVGDELMRRSPALRATFEEFKACGPDCTNVAQILRKRDEVLQKEWPVVLEYLAVYKDWGEARISKAVRNEFFKKLQSEGLERLRKCTPRMTYRWPVLGTRKVAVYDFEIGKLECRDENASGHLVGGIFFICNTVIRHL